MPDVPEFYIQMNFCRRCGSKFIKQLNHVFVCNNKHTIYANASPATATVILNNSNEVLVVKRAIEPGKGKFDLPGGFCDGAETLEDAAVREIYEEVGISRSKYSELRYVCSGIDSYDLAGEVLPVCSAIFLATLKHNITPKPSDDAAEAFFMPLVQIKPNDFYFPSLQKALSLIINWQEFK